MVYIMSFSFLLTSLAVFQLIESSESRGEVRIPVDDLVAAGGRFRATRIGTGTENGSKSTTTMEDVEERIRELSNRMLRGNNKGNYDDSASICPDGGHAINVQQQLHDSSPSGSSGGGRYHGFTFVCQVGNAVGHLTLIESSMTAGTVCGVSSERNTVDCSGDRAVGATFCCPANTSRIFGSLTSDFGPATAQIEGASSILGGNVPHGCTISDGHETISCSAPARTIDLGPNLGENYYISAR